MILLNKTIRGGLEIHAEPVEIRNCEFVGGPTCLRLIDCTDVQVIGCKFSGATGPPDPHGQCLQLIRSTGLVEGCRFDASDASEDLLSAYADLSDPDLTKQQVRRWQRIRGRFGGVHILDCEFHGRGKSDSSTSICADGPDCCNVLATRPRIHGARVGIQTAHRGTYVEVRDPWFVECEHSWLTWEYYQETK